MATPPPPALRPPQRKAGDRAWLDAIVRVGVRRAFLSDLYHQLMDARWRWVLVGIAVIYLVSNALFAVGYMVGGDCIENAHPGSFRDAFFFSVQTMATIGYGKMVPRSAYANILVSIEALVGLVGTAMATGLMFAKFARPTARVLFSNVAVVMPRDRATSLVFRLANERGNQVVEAQLRVVLARAEVTPEGEHVRRFHDLPLVRDRNAAFALSWTAVHPITSGSPLHGASPETLRRDDVTIIVSMMGLDETSAQTVHARYTYGPGDVLWDMRFVDIMSRLPDGRRQVDYTHFHAVVPLPPTG